MMNLLSYIVWNPDLEAFRLGPIAVRWYGLMWLIGFALAYFLVQRLYKEQKIKDELFDPLFVYCFLGILIGARLGHCIFYQPQDFLTSWQGIIEMLLPIHIGNDGSWLGETFGFYVIGYAGLASHGGTLGLMIALWLYVKKTKLSIWTVLDNIAIATGSMACCIRLGNLMNSEIIGKITDVPWAFIFEKVDAVPRHPGQLYEAIAYAILFIIMWVLHKRMPQKIGTGWYFGFCLTYIFTFRFFIEYTKEIQEAFEASLPLDMGQILSIPFIILGILCMAGGRWMRRLMTVGILLLLSPNVNAQGSADSDEETRRYHQLFAQDDAEAFYKASAKAKDKELAKGNRRAYNILCINEVNYEIRLNHNNRALKMASDILKDMREHKDGQFDIIYNTMASIYEDRGNYRMARYYLDKAMESLQPRDTVGTVGALLGMAYLEAPVHPDESLAYLDKLFPLCSNHPAQYMYALRSKAMAYFFKNDADNFYRIYDEYKVYQREHNVVNEHNDKVMRIFCDAFDGNYRKAVSDINANEYYSKNIARFNLRYQVYRIADDKAKMIEELQAKISSIDSLNANLIYENMNEMDAMMEVAKAEKEADRVRYYWLASIILMLAVAISLLLWRYYTRSQLQKKLLQQNKKLEIALSRAEESDHMQTLFIKHVSHEIRTPLNVITGFAQIITNPDYELEEEEFNKMVQDINSNTIAITNIVNEMLEFAQDESREYYDKSDVVNVNTVCRDLINDAQKKNTKGLKIDFITDIKDDFTICTNKQAVQHIIFQIMDNALKFTDKGSIEVSVHKSPEDNVLSLTITDTGIGIAEKDQEAIFDKFFKVDNFKPGFGLGLTVSRKMAVLLGGSLHLDKQYTDGARFILTLPTA